jgi:TolB protein
MPTRLIAVAGAATSLLLLLLSGCGGSSSKGNDDFVFVSTRDGAYELYSMNADGSHQHRLTPDRGNNSKPSTLYYQLDPAWSPSGKLIAFASLRDGPSHIFVVTADGKHTRRLTSGAQSDTHPTWSPDGRRIAFARGATGAIEVMNADGTRVHRVTELSVVNEGGSEGDPAWSRDGKWIAYDVKVAGGTTSDIWLVRPNGSDEHRLTSTVADSISPTWSPNSQRIAFSSDNGGSTLGVYMIGVSGQGLRLVTQQSQDAVDPAWSPDGNQIAFSTNGAITTVSLASTSQVNRLTDPKNNDSSPDWNPIVARNAKAGS